MNPEILAQAVAYGVGFTFGLFQTVIKDLIKPEWKAPAFVVLGSVSITGLYYGLLSGSVLLSVIIAAVSSSYAVTGGVDFYKKEVKGV